MLSICATLVLVYIVLPSFKFGFGIDISPSMAAQTMTLLETGDHQHILSCSKFNED